MVWNSQVLSPTSRRRYLLVIILIGIGIRLWGVTNPLYDHHGQRQIETAAMARNYFDGGMVFSMPQVDWGGDTPGYVESEFPIFTYAVAILYKLFGPHEMLGRLLNVVISIPVTLLVFAFARRLTEERVAFVATALFTMLPISAFFFRNVQPDALAMLCTLAALYYFWCWTEEQRGWQWLLSAVAISVAVLIKPGNLYLGLPLLYLCWRKWGIRFLARPMLWLLAVSAILPMVLWYRHAYTLWETYGNSLFRVFIELPYPAITERLWLTLGKNLLLRLIFAVATPAGLLFLFIGFFRRRITQNDLLYWWLAGFVVSIFLAPRNHLGHDYYQLPMMFPAAVWMAGGMLFLWQQSRLPGGIPAKPAVALLCVAILPFSAWEMKDYFAVREDEYRRVEFGRRVDALTDPQAKLIMVSPQFLRTPGWFQHKTKYGEILYWDPRDFYYAHRKGWSLDDLMATPEFVETLRGRGARYIATYYRQRNAKKTGLEPWLASHCKPIEVTDTWYIYELHPPPELQPGKGVN